MGTSTTVFVGLTLAALLSATVGGDSPGLPRPDVYSFHVISEIQNRYAKTLVTSRVANPANVSQEVSFDAVLPENAFVSGFIIEMDGKAYEAYVRGKEEAKKEYQDAVDSGVGAAHVELSARDSNVVSVSVNVEALKKVTFNLTYEELLPRELGYYNLRINLDPGQIVNDFLVEVHINETSDITTLEVPNLQENNEITDEVETNANPLAHIERTSPTTAVVRWAPTVAEQKGLRASGVKGQLLVRYDVNHTANPNQILVSDDGYFVHFFAPADLPALPKYIVFVLDTSGSMSGRKINQLREAILSILDELRPADNFTLITFSSGSQIWKPVHYDGSSSPFPQLVPLNIVRSDEEAIVSATPENIAKAKDYVKGLQAGGGTAMHNALDTAMRVSRSAVQPSSSGAPLLIVLLTDGLPNGSPDDIVRDITAANRERGAALFTLAFGEDADFGFLRRLALLNFGFGRRIYEAADAHLQLRNFYRQVASPLLSGVNFTYGNGEVEEESLTKTSFPTLFRGGELVVSGRVRPGAPLLPPLVLGNSEQPTRSPAHQVSTSSGERLWAFLTVRQLLDQDTATPNQTLKDRAKDIALKYSFVTPVTSLVVVKPNETSAVDLQRAGAHGASLPTGPLLALGVSSAIQPTNSFSDAVLSTRLTYYSIPPAPLGPGPSPGVLPPLAPTFDDEPEEEPTTEAPRLNLSDLTWIDSVRNGSLVTLEVNGTAHTYQLALNTTETHLDACITPQGELTMCRHLASCVLPTFADSLDEFLPYLCVVDSSFIGACCPSVPTPTLSG